MKANTMEMKNVSAEIQGLAVDYQTKISQLYTKFSNMTSVTKEWTGNKACEYVRYVLLDKPDMLAVGNQIKAFAKIISDDANLLESNASKVGKGETGE